jgi:hypothetical protein
MKKFPFKMACLVLAGGLLTSSCIGSFALTNKVLSWNRYATKSNYLNEAIFIGLHIVPVYWVTYIADILVLNSVEFWSGDNPVTADHPRTLKTPNGNLLISATEEGYQVTDESGDQSMVLKFDAQKQTWSVVADGESYEILKVKEDGTVDLNLQNGSYMNISLDAEGLMAARQAVIEQSLFVATR